MFLGCVVRGLHSEAWRLVPEAPGLGHAAGPGILYRMKPAVLAATVNPAMSDTPPDHLAINPASPHHDAQALERGVGVRFNDVERTDVEEYSVSEGWIRVQAGKARDRRGNPMTLKIKGKVDVRFLDLTPQG